jgi:hypothetical protein
MAEQMRTPGPLRVVDLSPAAAGSSEGYRQAGFDLVGAYDNWRPAVETHNRNHPGTGAQVADVMELPWETLAELRPDVLIGSPPCTQFSFSNRGGNGDIDLGMKLVYRFLYFVAMVEPRWWVMENVPRLASYMPDRIAYRDLGIDRRGVPRGPDPGRPDGVGLRDPREAPTLLRRRLHGPRTHTRAGDLPDPRRRCHRPARTPASADPTAGGG